MSPILHRAGWTPDAARVAIWWRQNGLCGLCWENLPPLESDGWEAHHRLKIRNMPRDAKWCPCNLVALHARCHTQGPRAVHDHPDDARALGLILSAEQDPRDVVVFPSSTSSPSYTRLQDLPPNSIVGTSSVRRKAQIARRFPHLKCVDVRGNLNTRLRKLDASAEIADGGENGVNVQKYDCLILAAAGLKRIDLGHRISQYLSAEDGVLYAPGQGALGLEIRAGDERMRQFLGILADGPTTLACGAERSLLKTLQGGCSAPVGVETSWEGERLVLRSSVISTDGRECVEASKEGVVGSYEEAEALGRELAEELLELGAEGILRGIREGAAQ